MCKLISTSNPHRFYLLTPINEPKDLESHKKIVPYNKISQKISSSSDKLFTLLDHPKQERPQHPKTSDHQETKLQEEIPKKEKKEKRF